MTRANYSTLDCNVRDALDCERAFGIYLWAKDRIKGDRCGYRAEEFAREASRLEITLALLLCMAEKTTRTGFTLKGEGNDLLDYILKRHTIWRLGGKKCWTEAA